MSPGHPPDSTQPLYSPELFAALQNLVYGIVPKRCLLQFTSGQGQPAILCLRMARSRNWLQRAADLDPLATRVQKLACSV